MTVKSAGSKREIFGEFLVAAYRRPDFRVDTSLAHESNRTDATRSANRYPKRIRYGNTVSHLVDPDLVGAAWLFELAFDYGKFDYVLHDGRVVLLDINKTPGESRVIRPAVMARLRHLASGISFFLP